MANAKSLSDSSWKDVVAKNKVKDNGLLKVLERYKRLDDDKHDDSLKALEEMLKLAGQLKKDKTVAAAPAVTKFLAELADAAETAQREVAKAKAEAEKKAKIEADKKAKAEAAKKDDEEDEDDEDTAAEQLLTTKLKPLLRSVAKGETMHALVAKAGKQVVVLLSRKPIPLTRRKMLAEQLGGGSTKYYPGHCRLEAGATTFALKAEVAGLAKLLKAALLQQTGLRINKIKCRGEDGDDDDEDDDEEHGMGVELEDDDDEAKEEGDETEARAEGDEEEVPRFVPGVEIDEAAAAPLARAPLVWNSTREQLEANIGALKKAIQEQCADEGEAFIARVNTDLAKIDRITSKLDRRLSDTLADAAQATDPQGRAGELEIAKAVLAEYIRYVSSEPLIELLDRNPFGVATDIKATLTKSLTGLARAIG